MPARRLKEYLDEKQIKYVSLQHSPAYTSQEVAASAHISGRDLAKTVIIKLDGRMAMAVLPANRKILTAELKEALGAEEVKFATEAEFREMFPDCDIGAMPPFGNLYGMEVYVAPSLAEHADMAFNAGTHTEIIKLAYKDFERLVQPRVIGFTT
jgi:Ala-tRNA(Pro) deacylase